MQINNNWIKTGALVAALAVVLGGLDWHQFATANPEQPLDGVTAAEQAAATISKAVYFQFVHALAIILVGVVGVLRPNRLLSITGFCFLTGVILFSGTTYLAVFVDYAWLQYLKLTGIITLVGAWILLVEAACPGWNKTQSCATNPMAEKLDIKL